MEAEWCTDHGVGDWHVANGLWHGTGKRTGISTANGASIETGVGTRVGAGTWQRDCARFKLHQDRRLAAEWQCDVQWHAAWHGHRLGSVNGPGARLRSMAAATNASGVLLLAIGKGARLC